MKIQKNFFITFSILTLAIMSFACSNQSTSATKETVAETSIITEIQEVPKSIDDIMESNEDLKPVETISTSELIKNALLKHFNEQFGNTDNQIKSVGYKMYFIEDAEPGYKNAYGFAKYMEYNIVDGKVEEAAGSGTAGIAINFSLDGKNSSVLFEILTDDDVDSANFKSVFPSDVQEKIKKRDANDISEVENNEKEMMKELYKKITGNDYKE